MKDNKEEREEGPIERRVWMIVGVLVFGSIGLPLVAAIFGGGDALRALGPMFVFGMMGVGLVLAGVSLLDALEGKRFKGLMFTFGILWALFFGSGFLSSIGMQFW